MTRSATARRALARHQRTETGDFERLPVGSLREERLHGEATLVLAFPASKTHPGHELPLPALNAFPRLRLPLAYGIALYCGTVAAPTSRRQAYYNLKSGLLLFLLENEMQTIGAEELNDDLLSRFAHWLERTEDGKPCESVSTRREKLQKIFLVLKAAAERTDLTGIITPPTPFMPWSPPPPSGGQGVLDADMMSTILARAAADAETTIERIEPYLKQLRGEAGGDHVSEAAASLVALLSAMGATPAKPHILLRSIPREIRSTVRKIVMPSTMDLIPFFLLLAHYTGFNTATLAGLRTEGVRRVRFAGIERIVISADKQRGSRGQAKPQIKAFQIDDAPTNPSRLLAFATEWTNPIRRGLATEAVWVAADSEFRDLGARVLLGNPFLTSAVGRYAEQADLPRFALTDIRDGILDLVHLASGADNEAVRREAGHASGQTAIDHYTSPAGTRREALKLARGQMERERWLLSEGRVDARRLPATSDRSAATPGFGCLDPYDSPMPGQRAGALCGAYGKCPICPHATVDLTSARACGFLHLLVEAIRNSFEIDDATAAGVFIGTWLPILKTLRDRWLPLFAEQTTSEAKLLDLPRLPEIE